MIDHRITSINADSHVEPYFSDSLVHDNARMATQTNADKNNGAHRELESKSQNSDREMVHER